MMFLWFVAEKTQAKKVVSDTAQLSTTLPDREVPVKPEQELADQFQLLGAAAGGGHKDTLIAAKRCGEKQGVWVLEGLQWIKQCDIPRELSMRGLCFCAVADGIVGMGGTIDGSQIRPVCYHYSFSEKKWRRMADMITPKKSAEAVEISPMVVMVLGGYNDKGGFSAECEILNVMEGEWSSVKPLPKYLKRVRVAAAGGRVFIMRKYGDRSAPTYELLEFNTSTNTYTQMQIDFKTRIRFLTVWIYWHGSCARKAILGRWNKHRV